MDKAAASTSASLAEFYPSTAAEQIKIRSTSYRAAARRAIVPQKE
jgi:hypothetical protein